MADYTQQLKKYCTRQAADSNVRDGAITRSGIVPLRESDLWLINTLNPGTPQMQF